MTEREKYLNEVSAKALGLETSIRQGVMYASHPRSPSDYRWNPVHDGAQCKRVQREFLEKRWPSIRIDKNELRSYKPQELWYCELVRFQGIKIMGYGATENLAILEAVVMEYERMVTDGQTD